MRDSFGRRERPRRLGRRLLAWVILLALVAGGALVLWSGTGGPKATLLQPLDLVGRSTPLEVDLRAGRAGLSRWEVLARRPDGTAVLVAEEEIPATSFLGSGVTERKVHVDLDAKALGLPEGAGRIEIYAADHAPSAFLRGHVPLLEIPVSVDLTPPRVRVRGGQHYVTQGGSDLVVYEVDDDTAESGVVVGDRTFPGQQPSGLPAHVRAALYAVPYDAEPGVVPRLAASDAAGNRSNAAFPVEVRPRTFPSEEIHVTDGFIDGTARPLLEAEGRPVPEEPIEAFLAVNRTMRQKSENELRELTAESSPTLAITGAFRQQPGTQVGSRFAERRTYRYGDQTIDHQYHLGYDLASVKQAPILAAQTGTVQAVTDLGIYGNVVILDHGLGLSSLYAHLSSTDVAPGDAVTVGQTIGHSGQTGLASGDHLHFSILVRGLHVDPIEWWDPKWVRLHVTEPLAEAANPAEGPG